MDILEREMVRVEQVARILDVVYGILEQRQEPEISEEEYDAQNNRAEEG